MVDYDNYFENEELKKEKVREKKRERERQSETESEPQTNRITVNVKRPVCFFCCEKANSVQHRISRTHAVIFFDKKKIKPTTKQSIN